MKLEFPKNWKEICTPAKLYVAISILSFLLGIYMLPGGFENYSINFVNIVSFIVWF